MSNRKCGCLRCKCKYKHAEVFNFRPFARLLRALRKKKITRAEFVKRYKDLQIGMVEADHAAE